MRVRYGMNEKQIGRKAEPIMHAITILFALTTSFICLGLNMFNDSSLWCWINASPIGCQQSYNNGGVTNCERGDNVTSPGTYRPSPLYLNTFLHVMNFIIRDVVMYSCIE